MPQAFHCTIVTPEAQVFDGEVVYASIPAWDGQVGLAHLRSAMLVKLGDGPLRLDLPKGEKSYFFIAGGFAQMKDDKLTLVANEATAATDLKRDEAVAMLKAAEARRAVGDDQIEARQHEQDRARAMAATLDAAR
ncbi:MAG: hypothetical protein GC164_04985 [Phycisphaera sp.]|nr:hypothetical protein [Phycisphaera sp.]